MGPDELTARVGEFLDQKKARPPVGESLHTRRLRYQIRSAIKYVSSYFLKCDEVNGSEIVVDGKKVINMGSCSYLGLEQDPRVIEGAKRAVSKYGAQFSSSIRFMSVALYEEMHELYTRIFDTPHVITAPSTTLAHLTAIPVIVDDNDLVLMDQLVHNSVQMAVDLLAKRKIPTRFVPHNDLKTLEEILCDNAHKYRRVWFFCDGIYSMSGDALNLAGMEYLRDAYKNLHLYIDDAHGMSWCGKNGRGYILGNVNRTERLSVAVSHSKCFGAGGGSVILSDQDDYYSVRGFGDPLIFGGPMQPGTLGAAVESAKIHLSEDIRALQHSLHQKIEATENVFMDRGENQFKGSRSPVFFLKVGSDKDVFSVFNNLMDYGYYTNPCKFPAVPKGSGGIRFTITVNHSSREIMKFSESLTSIIDNRPN